MDRHPLELASWIAGIICAIAVVIGWVIPQKDASKEQEPKKVASAVKAPPTEARSPTTSSQTTVPRIPNRSQEAINNDLLPQVALADAIYGSDSRNAAYVKIIDQALARNDYALVKDIIAKAYGSDFRNHQYEKAISQAIAQDKLEIAEDFASEIYGSSTRNAVLNRLLDARAKQARLSGDHATQPTIPDDSKAMRRFTLGVRAFEETAEHPAKDL